MTDRYERMALGMAFGRRIGIAAGAALHSIPAAVMMSTATGAAVGALRR